MHFLRQNKSHIHINYIRYDVYQSMADDVYILGSPLKIVALKLPLIIVGQSPRKFLEKKYTTNVRITNIS